MNAKKILFLTNIPSPYRVDFFNELGKLCRLTVIFEGERASDRNKKWISDAAESFDCIYLNGFKIGREQFFSLKIIKYLKQKWDYIIVGMYSTLTAMTAIEYMRIHKIKFTISADGGFIKKDTAFMYHMKRHFISAASAWFSSGKKTSSYLRHYGADSRKCFIYPFTSLKNCELKKNAESVNEDKGLFRKYAGISSECRIVFTVSQIIARKGIDLLAEVSKKTGAGTVFLIAGGEKEEWLNIPEDVSSRLRFIGFKTKEELDDYYRAADVFVLPTREDIWGLVINEAMSYGLPVVTTSRCIAGLELIDNGKNGYIVEPDNAKALAEAINQVFEHNTGKEMSFRAIEKIKNYSIENMAKAYMDIMEDTMEIQ